MDIDQLFSFPDGFFDLPYTNDPTRVEANPHTGLWHAEQAPGLVGGQEIWGAFGDWPAESRTLSAGPGAQEYSPVLSLASSGGMRRM